MTNCCDAYGNCRQGRECPVRKERIEQVAKVGKRMHGPEPLQSSMWRYWVRLVAFWLLVGLLGLFGWGLLALLANGLGN
jgi:hypothetical protein